MRATFLQCLVFSLCFLIVFTKTSKAKPSLATLMASKDVTSVDLDNDNTPDFFKTIKNGKLIEFTYKPSRNPGYREHTLIKPKNKGYKSCMTGNIRKIRILVPDHLIEAYVSIQYQLDDCSKVVQFPHKQMKLTNEDFSCVYTGARRALDDEIRFPAKSGKLYKKIIEPVKYLDSEYEIQRGGSIDV